MIDAVICSWFAVGFLVLATARRTMKDRHALEDIPTSGMMVLLWPIVMIWGVGGLFERILMRQEKKRARL